MYMYLRSNLHSNTMYMYLQVLNGGHTAVSLGAKALEILTKPFDSHFTHKAKPHTYTHTHTHTHSYIIWPA